MADFASAGTTETAGFTDTERRKVVMKNEPLGLIPAGVAINHLGFLGGGERCERDGLGLTTGKQRRSVRTRQETHFRAQRPDLKEAAPVAALLPIEDADPKGLFLKIVEGLRDFERRCIGIIRKNRDLNF